MPAGKPDGGGLGFAGGWAGVAQGAGDEFVAGEGAEIVEAPLVAHAGEEQFAEVVGEDRSYFQCARALARSNLWDPAHYVDRKSLPSTGTLTVAARDTKGHTAAFDAAAYDAALAERQKATLY